MDTAHKRRISLQKDFFDKQLDDALYGYLLSLTTWHPEEKVLYLTKKELRKKNTRESLYAIEDFKDVKNKKMTFSNRLKKLLEKGLVISKEIRINNKLEEAYIFPNPQNNFYLIDKILLKSICATSAKMSLQVYVYLANRMKQKQLQAKGELWSFTASEILEKIGYFPNSETRDKIQSCLLALRGAGLINYVEYYEKSWDGNPVPRMRLINVATELNN